MKLVWSLPVRGERLGSHRGDLVRAARLIEALRADGHTVTVVEDAERIGATAVVSGYRRWLRRALPPVVAQPLRDLGRWTWARGLGRSVAAVAARSKADLIVETQVHFAGSGGLAARRSGIPLVLDDCAPCSEETALGGAFQPLARYVLKRQEQAAQALVVSSHALRRHMLAEGIPDQKLRVIPNGVCLAAYARVDSSAARRRLGLSQEPLAGFVGSFQPWQGTDLLADVLAGLGAHSLHLLLIGAGPGLPRLLSRARALGVSARITAVGPVPADQVPELVACCDFGLIPASNEYGQPMKLLEYAAAGLAIVAPDLPPVRETVEHERSALLFPPGDLGAIVRSLERLLGDPTLRARLGRQARTRIAEGASWRDRGRSLLACVASSSKAHA